MNPVLTAFKQYLTDITTRPRVDESQASPPPSDTEVAELASLVRDAFLTIYNNALRACGVRVGDADSESNSVMLWNRVGISLDWAIGDGLSGVRKAELDRLTAELPALLADIDRAAETALEAHNTAVTLAAERDALRLKRDAVQERITKLKELI